MYCIRKVSEDITWIGSDNRRGGLFEGVYSIPRGVSYNSYFIDDEKTAVMDTADQSVANNFFENLDFMLNGRKLDYLIVQHMEPDHSASIGACLLRHPGCKVVCNKKTYGMITAFLGRDVDAELVNDNDTLSLGKHKLQFIFAPMVHWPEVMVTYDAYTGTLFSADAFGTFGALGGALFADEVNFDRDFLDEARRYYCNIVGKYGTPVMTLLNKMKSVDVKMLCPLHGFVWRENIEYFVNKYFHWAAYKPECDGVLIVYASIYGNTERAANALACRLYEKGIKCVMHDVSATESSYVIADAFKYSHLVFASPTYNGGIFVTMDNTLREIANHAIAGRRIAFIENGSWAPTAAKQMKEILSALKNTEFIEGDIQIRSSLHEDTSVNDLADTIAESFSR